MTLRVSDTSFRREVAEKSQSHLELCSQCLSCGSTCPVGFALDYTPNQLVRMVQLGWRERVLGSSAIWLCAGCETCAARCPYAVDIVKMIDTLREMALREGRVREKTITGFHSAFIESVRQRGRVDELSLMARYLFRTGTRFRPGNLLSTLVLGLKMLTRGKLRLRPRKPEQWKKMARLVRKAGTMR